MDSGSGRPAFKSITAAKLRDELNARGLSDSGKKHDLYRRFIESLEQERAAVAGSDSLENASGDDVRALVCEQFPCDNPEGLIDTASTRLEADTEPDELTTEPSSSGMHVGKAKGRSLLGELAQMRRRVGALETETTDLRKEVTEHRTNQADLRKQVADLQEQVVDLKEASASYEQHRELFLVAFKRDVLGNANRRDLSLIAGADALAHSGDMTFDKRFYLEAGSRIDERTFSALYGLSPLVSRFLSMFSFNLNLPHHLSQN